MAPAAENGIGKDKAGSLSELNIILKRKTEGTCVLHDVFITSAEMHWYERCDTCNIRLHPSYDEDKLDCVKQSCDGTAVKALVIRNITLKDVSRCVVAGVSCFSEESKVLVDAIEKATECKVVNESCNLMQFNFDGFKVDMTVSVKNNSRNKRFPVDVIASQIKVAECPGNLDFNSLTKKRKLANAKSEPTSTSTSSTSIRRKLSLGRKSNQEISRMKYITVIQKHFNKETKYANFLLRIYSPSPALVEAKSRGEHAVKNDEKLQVGYSYFVEGDIFPQDKDDSYSTRSKTSLRFEYIFGSIVATKDMLNTNPDEEFYPGDVPLTIREWTELVSNDTCLKYRLIKDVTLVSGEVYRYVGCRFCQKSTASYSSRKKLFQCSKCRRQGRFEDILEIFMTIFNITVEDSHGYQLDKIVGFNDTAVKLFGGKNAHEFNNDKDFQRAFQNLLNCRINLRLSNESSYSRGCKTVANHIGIQMLPPNPVIDSGSSDASTIISFEDLKIEISSNVITKIKPPIKACLKRLPSADEYDLDSKPSGYVLILNVFKYETDDEQRLGAEMDFLKLFGLFKELNFKIYGNDLQESLYIRNVAERIENFKQDLIDNNISSCAVVVMGHGSNNNFLKLSDGQDICIEKEIVEKFSSENFPDFFGKPKLFIMNICRSFSEYVVPIDNSEIESSNIQDAYYCYSTVPGQESRRDDENGSFFIDRMKTVFEDNVAQEYMHLENLFKQVELEMNKERIIYTNEDGEKRFISPCNHFGSVFYPKLFYFKVKTAREPSELDEVYDREMKIYLQRKKAATLNAIKENFIFTVDS